ncbi:MAG: DUF2934 domain-containing protein [Candidatus Firestonebacteria bacterium]
MLNIDKKKTEKINEEQVEKEIREKAHELFVKKGGKHGSDLHDWLEAEKIIFKKYNIKK